MTYDLSLYTLIISLIGLAVIIMVRVTVNKFAGGGHDKLIRDELRLAREDSAREGRALREEVLNAQTRVHELLITAVQSAGDEQKKRLADIVAAFQSLEKTHRQEQEKGRELLERKFRDIQEANERKLEDMRKTVDEKLQGTLEKRLGESFKLVGERLEAVQKGLGEMQALANGVGDLKRVLTNVKERGTWGEYQLGAILEEILAPGQFERNVRPRNGGEVVEFAVRLPGRSGDAAEPVWLPIDAKFPKEDYERLVDTARRADAPVVKEAGRKLAQEIVRCAKEISSKYLAPPRTTDFAIMFLPTEGLYAEVLRHPGLHDELQRTHRVLVAGPTTLAAILNSLRVGFQTLAIEKRAGEVWSVLGAVKTEFGKFTDILDKVRKQLNAATRTIDESAVRTRAMVKKLRTVQELPEAAALKALELAPVEDADDEENVPKAIDRNAALD